MTAPTRDELVVRVAQSQEREHALRLLLTSEDQAGPSIDPLALMQQADEGRTSLDKLFVALRNERMVGASWANSMAGRCAGIWVPRLVAGESETIASHLLDALQKTLVQDGVQLAQALLAPDDHLGANRLSHHGFSKAADLEYMFCPVGENSRSDLLRSDPLRFEPYCPNLHDRFSDVVEQTYQEARDCPKLNGLRDTRDVLDGYMQVGHFRPDHWLLAQHQQMDAGCLLLTDHAQHDHLELVYMGIVPSARGRGWGRLLVRYAQRVAAKMGRRGVVLAVDADNQPALDAYAAAHFLRCDQRQVFIKNLRRDDITIAPPAPPPTH